MVIIIFGTIATISSSFKLSPDIHRGVAYAEEALWVFYATIMLMRDLTNPNPPLIGLATIFIVFVAVRLAAEIWIAEPSDTELATQKRIDEISHKIDRILDKK
ncbi:hypothetical protein L248_2509 [Schleiferilactobacillus shenzhenensis LY-73]|uniref:Uncharacterized protein n=1 Tax=Schleiferilactobacillus shenzhenensis LY-73 TaxID=1231336 RepID=U4TJT9_9LACO|nr:hypothetical protein L248_2509 [Schleiferilactobacillus shenzhenensis LY-73]